MTRSSRDFLSKISQLFVWGFEGEKVSKSVRRLLRDFPPGGVILFKGNLKSPRQARALTTELQANSELPLLIGIDEEGGRVTRLPAPFEPLPPAAVLGRFYRERREADLIFRVGKYLARELISIGVNTNFAPVLDVDSNPKNPIIGDRAFSEDPKTVAAAAIAFYLGMRREGLIACGKHFPGHGDTKTDSHLTLPRVSKSRRDLGRVEFVPFRRATQKGIPMLMTAHVVYPALDRSRPATLSRPILVDLLRKKMRFGGVVISDDLNMKAISRKYSIEEASLLALQAGVDLILICKGGERGGAVIENLTKVIARDSSLKRRMEESFKRILSLKKKYLK